MFYSCFHTFLRQWNRWKIQPSISPPQLPTPDALVDHQSAEWEDGSKRPRIDPHISKVQVYQVRTLSRDRLYLLLREREPRVAGLVILNYLQSLDSLAQEALDRSRYYVSISVKIQSLHAVSAAKGHVPLPKRPVRGDAAEPGRYSADCGHDERVVKSGPARWVLRCHFHDLQHQLIGEKMEWAIFFRWLSNTIIALHACHLEFHLGLSAIHNMLVCLVVSLAMNVGQFTFTVIVAVVLTMWMTGMTLNCQSKGS